MIFLYFFDIYLKIKEKSIKNIFFKMLENIGVISIIIKWEKVKK